MPATKKELAAAATGKRSRPESFDKNKGKGNKKEYKPNNNNNKKFAHSKAEKPAPSTPAESRKIQQQKREYRKSLRTHHDLVTQAKTYWERIRDTVNVAAPERKKLIDELLGIIKGLLMDLIRKHDGSRIIQTCIKYGNSAQRKLIFTELEGHFFELAQKKYSRFLVNRFIDSASKDQKQSIFKEFYGNVISMIKHKDACEVIEKAYSCSTGFQKILFIEEFYGNEFALFKATETRTLKDILKENPEKQEQIMTSISGVINTLLSKGLIYLSIAHHVLNEYYENATPAQIREMTGLLAPELIHTVRTKFGAQIATKCIGYATAKERKIIIKSLKGNVVPICSEPYGHMLIVKLLSVTDDTVLLGKSVVKEMMESVDTLVTDGNGRLPFLQILAPENRTRYFSPSSAKLLEPSEVLGPNNTLVASSKKDDSTRHTELIGVLGGDLMDYCSKNVSVMIRDKFGFAVLLETLLHAEGDKESVMNEVIRLSKQDDDSEDHVISHPVASRFIKTLIVTDFTYQETESDKEVLFAQGLLDAIKNNLLKWATTDYASAIVIALLMNDKTSETAKKLLKPKQKQLAKNTDTRGTAKIVTLLDN